MNIFIGVGVAVGYALLLYLIFKMKEPGKYASYIELGSQGLSFGKALADAIIEDENSPIRKWVGLADIAVKSLEQEFKDYKDKPLTDEERAKLNEIIKGKAVAAVKILAAKEGLTLSDSDETLIGIAVHFALFGVNAAEGKFFRNPEEDS